ncbi:MAG: DUF2442 domain-containing protein [Pseudobdellovibrionaceae bacterium]|nr:DUF2442 domain-containing protein [Bdellovibrionales bacterium]USN48633.1 MAG: DUF2442 domain-containing protein [Pseudobdellovibrionaceae bacterium]
MSQTARKVSIDELSFISLKVGDDQLTAEISDGRIVSIPIAWFPRLMSASSEEIAEFEISPSGYGVHWPKLDEDISVRAFVG